MSSYRFDNYDTYPIIEILGYLGSGKSLLMAFIAWVASQEGISVFCNFHLKMIPYHYIRVYTEIYTDDKGKKKKREVNDILDGFSEDGTEIRDGLILYDEPQSAGLGKHQFWKQSTQDMAVFVSQIRKLDLALIMATQRENFPVFDVRQLVSQIFLVYKTDVKGIIDLHKFNVGTEIITSRERLDLRPFFKMYDSKELIGVKRL